MKVAVLGAGGVGGYYGARLAAGGNDVTFIARGAHLDAIRSGGLRVESPNGDLHIYPAAATEDPAEVGYADFVLLAPKLWDTDAAVHAIAPMMGPDSTAISFQNGVEAAEALRAKLGPERVMAGVAYIASTIAEPGLVRHFGLPAALAFGELDNRRSPRAEALLAACEEAGIPARIPDDIERTIWEKFIFLVAFSGVTSVTRRTAGAIRGEPVTRDLLRRAMEEAAAVAAAAGCAIPADHIDRQLEFVDGMGAALDSSMARDLAQGNRLELEWLQGAVVRLGRTHGVETPVNAGIYAALKLHADGSPA